MFDSLEAAIRSIYGIGKSIPLHAPIFIGNEKRYLEKAIDSTYVSSVGAFVAEFEKQLAAFTSAKHVIATVNGTSALHVALLLAGATANTEVITQSLTFVATCNAIRYTGARPVFVDVCKETLGLSPNSMMAFIEANCEMRDDGHCWNKTTNRKIVACIPMHTFGHSAELDQICKLCDSSNITVIEDAAESLGSFYKGRHTGTVGALGAMSFNGNKTITTGGGGVIFCNDDELSLRAKHLTTTAKVPHKWKFFHDEVGFNYRMPNINAALGLAQLETLPKFLECKRNIAQQYFDWGDQWGVECVKEPKFSVSNYWLNAILVNCRKQRNELLDYLNSRGIMARPAWTPMHMLPMNENEITTPMQTTEMIYDKLINLPSGVPMSMMKE